MLFEFEETNLQFSISKNKLLNQFFQMNNNNKDYNNNEWHDIDEESEEEQFYKLTKKEYQNVLKEATKRLKLSFQNSENKDKIDCLIEALDYYNISKDYEIEDNLCDNLEKNVKNIQKNKNTKNNIEISSIKKYSLEEITDVYTPNSLSPPISIVYQEMKKYVNKK